MITGTFLDEFAIELPAANRGAEEWRRDFASMKADGIDTVVLARVGRSERAAFDSGALRRQRQHVLLEEEDLVALFLALAHEHAMSLWVGTYDSGEHWAAGRHQKEIDLSRSIADEVWERYGRSAAFRGWHFARELDPLDDAALRAWEELGRHLRQMSGLPVLVTPALRGLEPSREPFALERHRADWERAIARLRGLADVVVACGGRAQGPELAAALSSQAQHARSNGIACWSIVDCSEPAGPGPGRPIAWPRLRHQLECALGSRADKIVTCGYGHFLSPGSMFPSAHGLHRRYRGWLAARR